MEENNRNDLNNNQTSGFISENNFDLNNGVQTNKNETNTIRQQVNNDSNKGNNKKRIVIIVALCALFSIIFIFLFVFVYINFKILFIKTENKPTTTNSINQNEFTTSNKTTTSITNTTKQNKTSYLDDSVVAQAYEDVMGKTGDINELYPTSTGLSKNYFMDLYKNKKIILDVYFTYENKMDIAITKLFNDDKASISEGIASYELTFTTTDLLMVYKKYFGNDKNINLKTFVSDIYGKCNLSDERYKCELESFSTSSSTSKKFITIYDGYKKENNKLYIYEYAVYSHDKKYYLSYSDSTGFSDEIVNLNGKKLEELKQHKSELLKFKHTFNKNSDGSFYWYSTEPVK